MCHDSSITSGVGIKKKSRLDKQKIFFSRVALFDHGQGKKRSSEICQLGTKKYIVAIPTCKMHVAIFIKVGAVSKAHVTP